jgi:hypothetical protein
LGNGGALVKTSPPQVAFSSGELDPLLARRFDYQRFQTGLARCRGFLPLPQGGFTRAPGTVHRGETHNNRPGILLPFQFAANDALVLEFTPGIMRVWRYGALIMSGAVPFTLATPYDASALERLQWVQTADVIYLADGSQPIQMLSRRALDYWTLEPAAFDLGPFKVQNLRKTRKIQASGSTGTVTLTASWDYFRAGHVGTLIRLAPTDNTGVPLWTSNESLTVGALRRYGDNIYELTAGTNAGENPPIHTEGVSMVNNDPTKWRFVSDGSGVVRVKTVTNGNSATAEVLKTIPKGCVDDPTYRWSEGAWSPRSGWPTVLELFDQRLVAAATASEPRTIWFSAVGDFTNFADGTEADEGFAYAISGDSSVNRILNARRGRSGLHLFALGEEYVTRPETRNQSIGPTNIVFESVGMAGSNGARPVAPDGDPIFISRDGQRIILLSYDIQRDGTRETRLSLPAQHLGGAGFRQLAWQAMPSPTAWIRMADGTLTAMIYDPAEDVLGWATLPLAGGRVISLATVPGLAGTQDTLTMIVARTVDGVTRYCVEEQAETFATVNGDAPPYDANYLFAAQRCTAPAGETSASFQLPHLAGQTVHAWTDQGSFLEIEVAPDGQLMLPVAVSQAWIGLFDETHEAVTLDVQAAIPNGNSTGRRKRLTGVALGVHRTSQGRVSAITATDGRAARISQERNVIGYQVATSLTAVHSGVVDTGLVSDPAHELSIRIRPYGGAPLTITSIVPTVQEAGG